jgi:excisionase family DNA binding protein
MQSPIAFNITEACASGGIGRTTLYEAIRAGELRAVKRGRRTLILVDDLRRWIVNLPPIETPSANLKSEGHDEPNRS